MKLENLTLLLRDGLANRMRVIASIAHFAKQGVQIKVLWLMNWALNCEYEKLFCPIDGFVFINIKNEPRMFHSYQNNIIKRYISKIYNKLKGYDYVFTKGETNVPLQLKPIFDNYQNVYVAMCYCLTDKEDYSIFKPSTHVCDILNHFNFNNYIGIHIRRGDHISSTDKSPINLFIDYIDNMSNNEKIYIATDSPDLKYLLTKIYSPERIISNTFVLDRNSSKGIIYAYVDMLILSKSKFIIGSQYSSFDEVVAN
ncbi:MAG: hypothetical protein MJ211_08995 [Bacteroidales bacterium]|nr:hypothetical protein [Bacteroidales bacterium]